MEEILNSKMFADMVDKKLSKVADLRNYQCILCNCEKTDVVLGFDDGDMLCMPCREYCETIERFSQGEEETEKRIKLLYVLHELIKAVGTCAPPFLVLSIFRDFFNLMRKIPNLEKAIREGLQSEREQEGS